MNPDREIKIIDLLPGDNGNDIVCTMRTSNIDSVEQYEALSYVWGHDMASTQISVSKEAISVTRNLYSALQQLRSQTEKRALWIDQLCINQQDAHDKTRQVNMMREIYEKCSRCVIWLGEIPEQENDITTSDAQGALDYLNFWAEINSQPRPALPNSLLNDDKHDATARAFDAMFKRGNPWWSRIWTVQEAVLPPKALVHWGPLTIDWDIVQTAALNMCRAEHEVWSSQRLHLGLSDLQQDFIAPVRGLTIAASGEQPLNLLQRWRHREATDLRDKIYGLMGLFPRMPFSSIPSCDYFVDASTLYKNVTIGLIEIERGLRPLVGARTHSNTGFPSWTIDFSTVPGLSASEYWWDHSHRYQCSNASGGRPMEWQILGDRSILSLKGILMDRIVEVGDVLEQSSAADTSLLEIVGIVESWRETLYNWAGPELSESENPYEDSLAVAFWMTLVGGYLTREFPIRRAVPRDWVHVLNVLADKSGGEVPFAVSLQNMTVNKAFFITESGYIGIGPPDIVKGDQVWVLYGGRVPFILRPCGETDQLDEPKEHTLVGNTYVHGLMDGEALNLARSEHTVWIY